MNNSDDYEYDPLPKDIENRIELSCPFVYPQDEPQTENQEDRSLEMLQHLASYVIPSKNPRVTFASLCFAAGMDVGIILGCQNTEVAISKALGIPKQTFSYEVKAVRKQYNLKHSSTIKHNVNKTSYQNNSRKIKS